MFINSKNITKFALGGLIICLAFTSNVQAAFGQDKSTWDYPRTVNYFLDSFFHPDEAELLAPWDVLVLSAPAQEWKPEVFKVLREKNPDIITLAYVSVSGVADRPGNYERFKDKEASSLPSEWWLKSSGGERLGYWPGSYMLNVTDMSPLDEKGQRWNDWLADWITDNIYSTGYWDGIFLDEAFPAVSWVNGGDIDLDGDGIPEDAETINREWQAGVEKITQRLRERMGPNAIIVVNGASSYTKYTNGRMQENTFKNGSAWPDVMATYINTYNSSGFSPKLALINSNTGNTGIIDRQQQIFGLTSTLLGDGFYSYDHGDEKHMSVWWSKDYETNLGQPTSGPKNLIGANDQGFIPGLWRRDFTNGTVFVNSTNKRLKYDITLHDKTTEGSLGPYSGDIITIDEFNENNEVEPETVDDDKAVQPKDSKPLYQDKPPLPLTPTTSIEGETGDEFEVNVTEQIELEILEDDNGQTKFIFIDKVKLVLKKIMGLFVSLLNKIL